MKRAIPSIESLHSLIKIGDFYRHNKTGNIYKTEKFLYCVERQVPVVQYTDIKTPHILPFVRTVDGFLKKFSLEK
jgi:hypothetical protein